MPFDKETEKALLQFIKEEDEQTRMNIDQFKTDPDHFLCECGAIIVRRNRIRHTESKVHIKKIANKNLLFILRDK